MPLRQLAEQVGRRDEDSQRDLLMRLHEEVRFGRTGLGLAFIEAPRQMTLDPARSDNLHAWASSYIEKTLLHSRVCPHPVGAEIAAAAKRAVVSRLLHHLDASVRQQAQRTLALADEQARTHR